MARMLSRRKTTEAYIASAINAKALGKSIEMRRTKDRGRWWENQPTGGRCSFWRFQWGVFSRVRVVLQLLERRTGLVGCKNARWIEKCSGWVLMEILECAHEFSRRVPVAEIVYLQLDQVLVQGFFF